MSEQELVKRYVTKYALTKGVTLELGKLDPADGSFRARSRAFWLWHTENYGSWPEALAKAETMRAKKIASLRAQIAKLESLVFVKPEGGVE